jgi:hypothetical protein
MHATFCARRLSTGLTLLVLAGLGGCQAAGVPAVTGAPVAPSAAPVGSAVPSAAPAPTERTPMPGLGVEPSKAWLLVGRAGEPDLRLLLSTTGEIGFDIPTGAPKPRWSWVATATPDGPDGTIVRDTIIQPGFGGPELRVTGAWQLPTIGLDPVPVGRSLDGSTIALVERGYGGAADPTPGLSRFAILEHALLDRVQTAADAPLRLARIVALPGDFEYDALSPDGRILYVVQHLEDAAGGRYQVRAVDVPTGVMRDAVIVDKANPDERMAGSPMAQLRRPDGFVLTLYRGPEHPFIHALMSAEAWALCIDLPAGDAGATEAAALDWGLAASPDGRAIYAVNATLGTVVDVDPTGFAVRRAASIATGAARVEPADGPAIALAKFGHSDLGATDRRLVVSPDGSMLYAAGAEGVVAIRTRELAVARRDLAGSAIDAIAITPPGTVLFALVGGRGEIVALDAATGKRLAPVPGDGYDRLLAVAPW